MAEAVGEEVVDEAVVVALVAAEAGARPGAWPKEVHPLPLFRMGGDQTGAPPGVTPQGVVR